MSDGPNKRPGGGGCRLISFEDRLERNIRTIHRSGIIRVLREHGAVEVDSREKPLAARVREKLRVQLPVRSGLCITANRSRCYRRVSTEFELVLQHLLKTLLVHRYKNEGRCLSANLKSYAASGKLNEYR